MRTMTEITKFYVAYKNMISEKAYQISQKDQLQLNRTLFHPPALDRSKSFCMRLKYVTVTK